MVVDSENVGVAFALVIAAGASTAIGASVVFFPSLIKLASRKTLAGGLGLSAGVMSYVSFVEILQKAVGSFQDGGHDYETAYVYATVCFFGGVVLMVMLNILVHNLLGYKHDDHQAGVPGSTQDDASNDSRRNQNRSENDNDDDEAGIMTPPCCAHDPAAQLDHVKHMADEMEQKEAIIAEKQQQQHDQEEKEVVLTTPAAAGEEEKAEIGDNNNIEDNNNSKASEDDNNDDEDEEAKKVRLSQAESKKLARMSLNTAVAIGLHNFPEGLATFVAALENPKVGALLAVAIAIHNVPEGLCVAMPVYYATGNKWRAFWWAVLSGISEPIAAVFGYLILASSFSDSMYAVLFGIVAGMMVIISVRELLPTAHRYDPDDSVVTFCFIGGMGIMALSLVLFLL